jgi:hypothetical protein
MRIRNSQEGGGRIPYPLVLWWVRAGMGYGHVYVFVVRSTSGLPLEVAIYPLSTIQIQIQ